ncbi:hypothetical protein GYMLUDRAFT_53137 [Collybiopsis luxurians FD-317 M1]|nr:hypothetical protein GYMLUDRAFT_53137 [Collybiopsis luxurians FD-317 M1]
MGNLLWFFLGAGAATMGGSHWGHGHRCHRHFSHGPAPPLPSDAPPQANNNMNANRDAFFSNPSWNRDSSSASSSSSPSQGAAASAPDPWAAEKERMREIGNQVGVNVLEFSESTLDTMLSSIQNMKTRVIQQRQEREKLEAEQKRSAEEQRMNPPRYV